jgi:dolichol-phosphate mannosyltransferase
MIDDRVDVSVVFSFRNEEKTLPELITRTQRALSEVSERYEIIFVNDASTDRSLEMLVSENARDTRIKVINMSRRFGVSECVIAGFRACSGEAVIYLDADLQDPPEVISKLIRKWREGADVVHTVRLTRKGENPFKLFLTRCAYRMISFGATIEIPEDAGDFKLLSRRALAHLLALPEHDPYLRGLAAWVGFTQVTLTYERSARQSGDTHFSLVSRNPFKTFVSGLTSFSFMPLYLFVVIGLLLLGAGLLAEIVGVFGFISGRNWAWWSLGLGFALLVHGLLVSQINVVAIYVLRTYKDVRGRPRYIVADAIGLAPLQVAAIQDWPIRGTKGDD